MKKAVILDTSAIMYRNHYALKNMRNSKGMSTGATYGFVNTLEAILREFEPDYIVACLDVKRSELKRSDVLESYKAHRESMPEELREQQEDIMELLDGYKIPKYKVEGYEADDVIATLATLFSEDKDEEIETFVLTGDKDLAQLVNGKINIALLGKGDKKNSLFKHIRTKEDVINHIGVAPEQIPDYFGLMGDASDGIPGVSGIGPKKGKILIEEYGNLETIYEKIDERKGKEKENLIAGKESAFLSRRLATVKRDVDVEYDKEKLKLEEKDLEKLLSLYRKMEFKKFSLAIEGELMEKAKAGRNLFDSSSTSNENSNPQMSLFSNQLVSQETEKFRKISWENGLDEISKLGNEIGIFENEIGLALSNGKENIVFLNEDLNGNAIKNEIYKELGKKKIIGYNVKELVKSGIDTKDYFDVMLAWYVLGTESPMDLEHIVYTLVERTLEKFETVFKKKKGEVASEDEKIEFLGKRALCIKKVEKQLKDKLIEEGLDKIYEDLESRLVPVLASMELEGIKIDKQYFSDYKTELEEKIKEVTEEIYELSGEEFNIGSPKQLSQILFEKMGIEPIKKTKTGYSTDVKVLEELSLRGIEIAGKLLDYRGYTKLLSTYVEPIPKLADENDRIHTTFHQNGTATGRLSSSNPNLQNIPARTDDGIKIRKGFISKEGWSLISFDYSQIELRVLAELSKDEHLIEAYRKGEDLHELTARKIFFKMDNEEITRMERSIAKVINFSVLYGKTPFGLSQELKITVEDATKYIRTYFEQYPKVREFLDNILENAKKNGFVETLYGTRRYIFGINSSNKNIRSQADRMAVNTVIQGTAANIIKKVMIELYERFKNESDIKMLLQVHDELIFEVKDEAIEKYLEKIEDIMENTIVFKDVRLEANGANAKNWGELK